MDETSDVESQPCSTWMTSDVESQPCFTWMRLLILRGLEPALFYQKIASLVIPG
jgi:hypothetical protein